MKIGSSYKITWRGVYVSRGFRKAFFSWISILINLGIPANFGKEEYTRPMQKIIGYDQYEILSQWVSMKYPYDHIVVLVNVNVQAKKFQFWSKVPQSDLQYFLKDIVIMRCKDIDQIQRLVDNIPTEFAEAYGYSQGCLISYNKEDCE